MNTTMKQLVAELYKSVIGDQQAQGWRERVTQLEGIIWPMIHAILDLPQDFVQQDYSHQFR